MNNRKLSKPVIVCAAIRFNDIVVCGARHYDITMHNTIDMIGREYCKFKDEEQGFIDQHGQFYDRKDAMKIAIASGQKIDYVRNGGNDEILYSEGLY